MQPQAFTLIEDINTRQDDALRQIDDLNERIEHLIELCVATAKAESSQFNPAILASTTNDSIENETDSIAADADDSISMLSERDDQAGNESQLHPGSQSKAA